MSISLGFLNRTVVKSATNLSFESTSEIRLYEVNDWVEVFLKSNKSLKYMCIAARTIDR